MESPCWANLSPGWLLPNDVGGDGGHPPWKTKVHQNPRAGLPDPGFIWPASQMKPEGKLPLLFMNSP